MKTEIIDRNNLDMKRRNFLKKLFGVVATSSIPTMPVAAAGEREYSHDDIFYRPHNNDSLVYFKKDHTLYKELEKRLQGRIVDSDEFRCYRPLRSFVFPVKEKYRLSDFDNLIALLNSRYEKSYQYARYSKGTFMRFTLQENNIYQPDLFLAMSEKYGSNKYD